MPISRMSNWKWFFTVVGLTSLAWVVVLLLITDDPYWEILLGAPLIGLGGVLVGSLRAPTYWEDRAKKLQIPSDDSVD